MYESIEMIKSFTTLGLGLLNRRTTDLTEEQLDWKYCAEANTIRWILTHLTDEMFVFFPKVVKGDKAYRPDDWPKDYTGNTSYSLEEIKENLEKGKQNLMAMIDGLNPEDLVEEMDYFAGTRPKQYYLLLGISEIFRHEGQIAAILGVENRMQDS